MDPLSILQRLRRDEAGVSTILLASSFTALIGSCAFAIDLGSMYLAQRKLQGLADSAAMAVGEEDFAQGAESSVRSLLVADGSEDAKVVKLVPGKYTADPAIAPKDRFQPSDAAHANAMKVMLEQDVPLTFGAFLTRNHTARVHAEAIASRRNLAAFSIGTRLTNLGGNVPNQVLSALAGTNLNLSSDDIALLAMDKVDLFAVANSIAAQEGLVGRTYGEIFSRQIDAAELLSAIGEASDDPSVANLLAGISTQLGGSTFSLSQIADIGELGRTVQRDGQSPLLLDSLTMTRLGLQLSQGQYWNISAAMSVAGLTGTTLRITGTNSTVHSPMLTITAARDVILRSSSMRLYLKTTVATGNLALASIKLPVYVEAAPGEARMLALSCASGDPEVDGVTLGVKPSIGNAAIGSVDEDRFDDFSQALTILPAELAKTPLFKVNGSALLSLGGNAEQQAFFNKTEIAEDTVKSIFTTDAVNALTASLSKNTKITVTALGLGVNASTLSATAGSALSVAAPAIDSLLTSAMRTTGVGLGVSDVAVDRLSCGIPVLVG
ncbi:MAG: pilus assembly protein TadG-related protein [Novosphingobium sp.]